MSELPDNLNEAPSSGLLQPRLILPLFEWGGDMYPVIADLPHGCKLVAHKNAPAITDGNLFMTLDQHNDDDEDEIALKRVATRKFNEWAWTHLHPRLACPTYGQNELGMAAARETPNQISSFSPSLSPPCSGLPD